MSEFTGDARAAGQIMAAQIMIGCLLRGHPQAAAAIHETELAIELLRVEAITAGATGDVDRYLFTNEVTYGAEDFTERVKDMLQNG